MKGYNRSPNAAILWEVWQAAVIELAEIEAEALCGTKFPDFMAFQIAQERVKLLRAITDPQSIFYSDLIRRIEKLIEQAKTEQARVIPNE